LIIHILLINMSPMPFPHVRLGGPGLCAGKEPALVGQIAERELVVSIRKPIADRVISLGLTDPAGEPLPAWRPGAHIDVVLPNGMVRQYSLCGDPHISSTWHIAVQHEALGRGGSSFIHQSITEGSTVSVRGPRNNFEFGSANRYAFVAGGIGITPLMPMIAEAERSGACWSLVYGGRTRASMAFSGELVARYSGRVHLVPQDTAGMIDLDVITRGLTDDTDVYCCGPEGLLAAVEARFAGRPSDRLHIERFSAKLDTQPRADTPLQVTVASTGQTFKVPAGKSILSVLLDHGVDVDWACEEGTCGTCVTAVLNGVIDHRDSVLTPEERASGTCMTVCVSRADGASLTLDL
jgi:ferredoxin-NADP reductase